jgi:hypothetical protein
MAVVAAPAVQAAGGMGDNWSFEIGVGQATYSDMRVGELDAGTTALLGDFGFTPDGSSTLKRRDRSYSIITSYRFNDNWAFETGYFRLGAFQYTAPGTAGSGETSAPGVFHEGFRAKGVMLGAAYIYPLTEMFEIRGRAGLGTTNTRVKQSLVINAATLTDKFSASSQDFYVGVGVGLNLGYYYRLGFDYMLHRDVGKPRLTQYDSDVSNLLLSMTYRY